MASYRKNLIILIFSILIYFVLNFLYKFFFLDSNIKQISVLNKDISKGQEIVESDIDKLDINILNMADMAKNYNFIDLNTLNGKVAKEKLNKGQMLNDNLFIDKSEYIVCNNKKEIISIKTSNSDDIVSYQISSGSYINIYFTGKTNQVEKILEENSKDESISSGGQVDGYTTIKILDGTEVIAIFDKYGNKIDMIDSKKNESMVIDTVMLEVDKNKAMLINNLKNYGKFSLSIVPEKENI